MKVEVNLGELPLATYRWQYEAGQPKAVVQIIHSISGFYGSLSTKADEIPSRIHKRRGEGKAEGGRG